MKDFVISEVQNETAVLVGLITQTQDDRKTKEYLDELAFLAETAGAEIVKQFTQKLDTANSVTYVGKGKLQEIKEYLRSEKEEEREIGMVIFDDELSAKQLRNIEAELQVKILDRTSLILDIFAMRAQTANAKTQVELAQYKYMLPRLQRLWTHLERQGGGSGSAGSVGLRGPGETQLETDRRLLGKRVKLLKERLLKLERQRGVQRKARTRRDMLNVSLVGYTNAGKSTLFNALTHAGAYAADQLFATLDTTSRKLWLDGVGNVVVSDTVGFIRDLPHSLVAAFHATLDATSQADLLLHVIDSASPSRDEQIAEVNKVLEEIGASEVPQLMVLNKLDLTGLPPAVERNEYDRIVRVRVSAKCGDGLPLLRAALTEVALEKLRNSSDRVSAADQPIRSDQILDSDSFL